MIPIPAQLAGIATTSALAADAKATFIAGITTAILEIKTINIAPAIARRSKGADFTNVGTAVDSIQSSTDAVAIASAQHIQGTRGCQVTADTVVPFCLRRVGGRLGVQTALAIGDAVTQCFIDTHSVGVVVVVIFIVAKLFTTLVESGIVAVESSVS